MSRLAAAAFVAIIALVGYALYQMERPRQLVTETDNRDLLSGMATNQALGLTALVPPTPSRTPTRTPRPPTSTPRPTYRAGFATPGVQYVVERQMPAADVMRTEAPVWCVNVTPDKQDDTECEVRNAD